VEIRGNFEEPTTLQENLMKIGILAALFLGPVAAWAGASSSADYTVAVHVQSSSLFPACTPSAVGTYCQHVLHLTTLIDGKKIELEYVHQGSDLLRVGDYKAKITKDDQTGTYEYRREYEFLFPDGSKGKFLVIGESE
jgi:hypothetical protein